MAIEETNKPQGAAGLPAEEPLIKNEAKVRKMIMWASVAVSIVVVAVLIYVYAFRTPDIEKGNQAIGEADTALIIEGNDSTALAQYEMVATKYGHAAGNRANLNAAILLFQKGEYDKALAYLKSYSPSEAVIGAAAASLEGDCYVNLDNLSDAAKSFKKAIKLSDDNPAYTPFFMMKLATVLTAQNDYAAAADVYQEISSKYPAYGPQSNIDIEKYLDYCRNMAK